jgi:hypothetical protein
MIWQPNKWQAAALRVYGDGDYRYVVDGTEDSYADGLNESGDLIAAGEPALTFTDANEFDDWCVANLGDTLLLFIMRELSDANDDGEGGDEMVRMIERAIDDLESVLVPLKLLA